MGREFVYYSGTAKTSGNFDDLMKAGRIDIALHVIVNTFFLSHKLREDTKLHLIFYGPPTPPRHLEFVPHKYMPLSKKDLGGLIKRMLYKYKEGRKEEVFPGCYIEKKNMNELIEELKKHGKTLYLLDERGKDIRDMKIEKDCVFILGDHHGFPLKELKSLREKAIPVSIGNKVYFASQVVAIVNNELDRMGI